MCSAPLICVPLYSWAGSTSRICAPEERIARTSRWSTSRIGPHFLERRKRSSHNRLTAAGGDPGSIDFVTTFVVRRAGRDVSDQIVAVANHEGMSEVRIPLEGETKLDKQFAWNSDHGDIPDRKDRHRG